MCREPSCRSIRQQKNTDRFIRAVNAFCLTHRHGYANDSFIPHDVKIGNSSQHSAKRPSTICKKKIFSTLINIIDIFACHCVDKCCMLIKVYTRSHVLFRTIDAMAFVFLRNTNNTNSNLSHIPDVPVQPICHL